METSLSKFELSQYLSNQLNNYFPDGNIVKPRNIVSIVELALERISICLSAFTLTRYKKDGKPYFDHLISDAYMLFLCYLANSVWHETNDSSLSSKIYYLNKAMHSFDCKYDHDLPEIFLIIHGAGTVMGKAEYGNYFVVFQGCTIGESQGHYPKIGNGVAITANSSAIGKCKIGDRATVGFRTTLMRKNVPNDHTAFMDPETGTVQVIKTLMCYAQQFFNIDLKTL